MKKSLILCLLVTGIGACDQRSDMTNTPNDTSTGTRTGSTDNTKAPTMSPSVTTPTTVPTTNPSNTGINTRDRDPAAMTAGMQSQAKGDIDIAAAIRKRVTDTKMSVNAQNVKIITENGKVTLRGPVNNEEEKTTIGSLASDMVGASNVDNQLEVKQNP